MNESKATDSSGQKSDMNDVNSNVNSLTEEDTFELHRLRVLQEIQEEVTAWIKKRFWLYVLIATVLGFFGVSAIIESSIRSSVDKELEPVRDLVLEVNKTIGKSEALLEFSIKQIERAIEKARIATGDAASKATNISLLAQQLETEIMELRQDIKSLSVKLASLNINVRQEARVSIDNQAEQIKNIERLVAELSSPTTNTNQKINEIQTAQKVLRTEAEVSRERYELLSQYQVDIIVSDIKEKDLEAFKKSLRSSGFIIGGVFGSGRKLEKTASLWGVSENQLSGKFVVLHDPEDGNIAEMLRKQLLSISGVTDVSLVEKTTGSKKLLGIYVPRKL